MHRAVAAAASTGLGVAAVLGARREHCLSRNNASLPERLKQSADANRLFGYANETPVLIRTIQNGTLKVKITDFGATITSVQVPDQSGETGEVTLGFDKLAPYTDGTSPYFGCVAGRVANRTAKATFHLDGSQYKLSANNGQNHLHGGQVGFDKQLWCCEEQTATSVTLALLSRDGDQGYPGSILARVTYSLPSDCQLKMEFSATSDAPTLCNLTNHTYWNLSDGGRRKSVLEHEVELAADHYTPVDAESIPTGEIKCVSGAMDLTRRTKIGAKIGDADNGNGYDHNYVIRSGGGGASESQQEGGVTSSLRAAARVYDPHSGRFMIIHTDQPGIQFYTGNYLNGLSGRDGGLYKKHSGFCMECQNFPDSANVGHFPSIILRPGQKYSHTTVHTFGVSRTAPTGAF